MAERNGRNMAKITASEYVNLLQNHSPTTNILHIDADGVIGTLCGETGTYYSCKLADVTAIMAQRAFILCPKCEAKMSKTNTGKLRYDLVPFDWYAFMAKNMTYGNKKGYKEESWRKNVSKEDYFAAAMRHIENYFNGKIYDPEHDNLHAFGIAACNLLMAMTIDEDKRKENKT